MSRHRKATVRSKWTLFCVCLYVCNDLEWETAYEQATKKGFQQNSSQGRERESFIMFFGRIQWIPPVKIEAPARGSYISLCRADHCHDLSIEILNILYDRHGPNPGFFILRTFEHLKSNALSYPELGLHLS